MNKKYKLTTIIVASFVTVFALFIIGISLLSYTIFFDFTSQEISEARLALLNENTRKVSNLNSGIKEAAAYIAANKTVIETFSEPVASDYRAIEEQRALEDLLNGVASLKTSIHSIEMFTSRYDAYPRISDQVIYPLEELKDEAWYSLFENMDSGWIPKHQSRHGNLTFISYVNRLINHRGNTVGYVKVNVLDNTFFSYLTDDDMFDPKKDPMIVLDSGGRIVSHKGPSHASVVIDSMIHPAPSGSYMTLKDSFDRLSDHHQVLKHGNELYLLLISEPNYERWRLVQLIPIDPLYAQTKELGLLVVLLGLCGLLLSVPLAYWVGKRIIVPILKIIQGMRSVERGRFDVRLQGHYIEEYDVLANNFNHMITELDHSLKQIKAENRARRDAELRTLQNQITPHFLYNTLDVIHWKAMDHQAEDISHMVNQLSKMFRIGLSGGKTFITLWHELEHAKAYVEIQQIRMDRQIRYDVKVSASMKKCYVPKVVLQPFIENSMRHGYPDEFDDHICIRVRAEIVEEQHREYVELRIEDNGTGLPEGWHPDSAHGIGIRNVKERIHMYCGHDFGIELFNRPEGGVAVRMLLPVIRNEAELQAWMEREQEWFEGG